MLRQPAVRAAAPLIPVAAAAALAGCQPPLHRHGNMPEQDEVARIESGKDTRRDVRRVLGPPSMRSPFAERTWYYIGANKTQIMFFRPEVQKRRVYKVAFAPDGTVAETDLLRAKAGRAVDPVDRITPSPGRDLSLLEQLLGNIGQFSPKQAAGNAGTPGPSTPGP